MKDYTSILSDMTTVDMNSVSDMLTGNYLLNNINEPIDINQFLKQKKWVNTHQFHYISKS